MVIDQLNIAPQIVTTASAALIGTLALAFGLGGAAQMLNDAYRSGQQNRGQVKQDMQVGRERAEQDARRAQSEAQRRSSGAGEDPQGGSERR